MTSPAFPKSASAEIRIELGQKAIPAHIRAECTPSGTDQPSLSIPASQGSKHQFSSRISERGVSLAELVLNVAIVLILASMSVPTVTRTIQTFRVQADARRLYSLLTLARMRAAANFTKGELSSSVAGGTFQVMLYNNGSSSYVNEGGIQNLSSGNSFSYGTISAPAGTQSPISESAAIIFNSRGIPVDSGGTPTGNYALYLSNGSGLYYAVTVSITGTINIWVYSGGNWTKNI